MPIVLASLAVGGVLAGVLAAPHGLASTVVAAPLGGSLCASAVAVVVASRAALVARRARKRRPTAGR